MSHIGSRLGAILTDKRLGEHGRRGSGRTTNQLISIPKNGIFIWCNNHRSYPVMLARSLGRDDVRVETPDFLDGERWQGLNPTAVIIDHACRLTPRQYHALEIIQQRIQARRKSGG